MKLKQSLLLLFVSFVGFVSNASLQIRISFLLTITWTILLVISSGDSTNKKRGEPDLASLLKEIQSGDLVFRRGRSLESHAVLLSDQKSPYSHVGIICIENGEPYIIHAVPGGNDKRPEYITKEKIGNFLSIEKASNYAVYRTDFTEERREAAARNALGFFINHFVFDKYYDLKSDSELYCTELVLKAYNMASSCLEDIQTTELNFGFRKKQLILPGNLIENPHLFKIIHY